MRHTLLLSAVFTVLSIGAQAYSQYIYMDANGDGVCTTAEVLSSSTKSVDIWLNTNHNAAGSTSICSNPSEPLDIFSYDIVLHASGAGGVQYKSWSNNMTNYALFSGFAVSGADMGVGYQAPFGTFNVGGLYKLGSISVAVTGSPTLTFLTSPPNGSGIPSSFTGFGSPCDASEYPNTIALGLDFQDTCGTSSWAPTETTTWGRIKQLYR